MSLKRKSVSPVKRPQLLPQLQTSHSAPALPASSYDSEDSDSNNNNNSEDDGPTPPAKRMRTASPAPPSSQGTQGQGTPSAVMAIRQTSSASGSSGSHYTDKTRMSGYRKRMLPYPSKAELPAKTTMPEMVTSHQRSAGDFGDGNKVLDRDKNIVRDARISVLEQGRSRLSGVEQEREIVAQTVQRLEAEAERREERIRRLEASVAGWKGLAHRADDIIVALSREHAILVEKAGLPRR